MAKREDLIQNCRAHCGDCDLFEEGEGEEGECYFNPPILHFEEDGYVIVRPPVSKKDRACGRFKPRN